MPNLKRTSLPKQRFVPHVLLDAFCYDFSTPPMQTIEMRLAALEGVVLALAAELSSAVVGKGESAANSTPPTCSAATAGSPSQNQVVTYCLISLREWILSSNASLGMECIDK